MPSTVRPEVRVADPSKYAPRDGTAYLMIYNAVQSKSGLIAGRLHAAGESCAIGSFFDVNPQCALGFDLVDEIAAVNDSFVCVTPRERKRRVLRWLRWKLAEAGMPGFHQAPAPKK